MPLLLVFYFLLFQTQRATRCLMLEHLFSMFGPAAFLSVYFCFNATMYAIFLSSSVVFQCLHKITVNWHLNSGTYNYAYFFIVTVFVFSTTNLLLALHF